MTGSSDEASSPPPLARQRSTTFGLPLSSDVSNEVDDNPLVREDSNLHLLDGLIGDMEQEEAEEAGSASSDGGARTPEVAAALADLQRADTEAAPPTPLRKDARTVSFSTLPADIALFADQPSYELEDELHSEEVVSNEAHSVVNVVSAFSEPGDPPAAVLAYAYSSSESSSPSSFGSVASAAGALGEEKKPLLEDGNSGKSYSNETYGAAGFLSGKGMLLNSKTKTKKDYFGFMHHPRSGFRMNDVDKRTLIGTSVFFLALAVVYLSFAFGGGRYAPVARPTRNNTANIFIDILSALLLTGLFFAGFRKFNSWHRHRRYHRLGETIIFTNPNGEIKDGVDEALQAGQKALNELNELVKACPAKIESYGKSSGTVDDLNNFKRSLVEKMEPYFSTLRRAYVAGGSVEVGESQDLAHILNEYFSDDERVSQFLESIQSSASVSSSSRA